MTAATTALKRARPCASHDHRVDQDDLVLRPNATWEEYQRLLHARGEGSVPRIAYLDGVLEILTPSLPHESHKTRLGRLVEVWCLEKGIEFSAGGSWTLKSKRAARGVEPDECYVFGEAPPQPKRPDLAIEVVLRSGGLDKLDIYGKLGVREVWFWREGRVHVHALRGDAYEAVPTSEVLPGIDLAELTAHLDRPTDSQAIREYRARLQARRQDSRDATRKNAPTRPRSAE